MITEFGIDYGSGEKNKPPLFKSTYQSGCRFAIIRGAYGTTVDPTMKRDRKVFRDSNIAFGAYLFLRYPYGKTRPPGPEAQVKAFSDALGALEPGDLPPVLDIEFPRGGREKTGMGALQCLQYAEHAYDLLRARYQTVMIYTSARVWKEDLLGLVSPKLAQAPLWIKVAYYWKARRPWDTTHQHPIKELPAPWRSIGSPGAWIKQYQGDATGMPGITRTVDMNAFLDCKRGEKTERVRWLQKTLVGRCPNIGAVDGDFGPKTEMAVRTFQTGRSLPATGIVDVRTFASLCS